ncbi:unnamed protein product [Orchesella dallaii]|uniref:Uncharacterized protein n=1 Tax=Orchesella dallaii TaxID=48710 RepID=A0ABP1RL90_9HEXA
MFGGHRIDPCSVDTVTGHSLRLFGSVATVTRLDRKREGQGSLSVSMARKEDDDDYEDDAQLHLSPQSFEIAIVKSFDEAYGSFFGGWGIRTSEK